MEPCSTSRSWNTKPPTPTCGTTSPGQKVTSELSHTQGELRRVEGLRQRVDDLPVPLRDGRGRRRGRDEALADADAEPKALQADVEAMEVRTLLSGEYDEREALVTIRSGAGEWTPRTGPRCSMRMYIRWAEQHSYPLRCSTRHTPKEAGIKSATFAVHAPFAYGTLSVEQGTHRLVRISRSTTKTAGEHLCRSRVLPWSTPPTTSKSRNRRPG